MADSNFRLDVTIRAIGGDTLDGLALGELFQDLVVPLSSWQLRDGRSHCLRVEFERTHEWELLVGLLITGAGLLAKGFCEEFGKELARKLIKMYSEREAEIKTVDQTPRVLVERPESKSIEAVSRALGVDQMAEVSSITIARVIEVKTVRRR